MTHNPGEILSDKINFAFVEEHNGVLYASHTDWAKGKPLDYGREIYVRLRQRFGDWDDVVYIEVYQDHYRNSCIAEVGLKTSHSTFKGAFCLHEESTAPRPTRKRLIDNYLDALEEKLNAKRDRRVTT